MANDNEVAATNWTLSFKHEKITVLLYTEPLTPFTTLKEKLLTTLKERYPSGLPQPFVSTPLSEDAEATTTTIPHPGDPADIILGKRVSNTDEEAGWEGIDLGKGEKATPKSVGLNDGNYVAFAYKETYDEEVGFVVKRSTYYEDQAAEEEAVEAEKMDEDE